jgi:RHS repeat-associated protein
VSARPRPVTPVSDGGTAASTGAATVSLVDSARGRARVRSLGGTRFAVERTDGGKAPATARIRLDYSGLAQKYGGSYGARLGLVQLPACALSTPARPGCTTGRPVPSRNDGVAQVLTAEVPVGGSAAVFAATSTASGAGGDYTATSLAPSATWRVGTHSGTFNWSYPMRVPPVPGDLYPELTLSYSSDSVDGRTSNTNGQPSWVGEGFSLASSFIERRYRSCGDDGAPKDEWGVAPADLCWAYDNATMTLNGEGGELISAGSGLWRLRDDDGTRIEKLTGTTGGGDNDGEYWKVTTTDGTQYFFGRNRLPGWSSGKPETRSVWTVPVYGDDAGEPCHGASFAGSWCQQAWRWNLDYVVDPHGNAIAYYYTEEANRYGRNLKPDDGTPYDRGGYLTRIEYGLRDTNVYPATPPARVVFTTAERCIRQNESDCAPSNIDAHPDYWWDVPWDLSCPENSKCEDGHGTVAPTFWSRKRLTTVTTQVARPDGGYRDVDSWALQHTWGLADIDRDLLLHSITHTGKASTPEVTLPPTTFSYTPFANRVDKLYDDIPPFMRYRLDAIVDEWGGITDVNYSAPDCAPGDLPSPATNTRRCYPVYWQPPGREDPIQDWFHKYVVTQVVLTDRTGGAPDMVTNYSYLGGAAWHFDDDDGLTKEKHKTWSQWRGYGQVQVRSGGWNDMRTQTDYLYLRGMDGDRAGASGGAKDVFVSDGEGGRYEDHESYAGFQLKSTTYTGPGGSVVTKTVTTPWHHQTASRTRDWGTVTANLVDTAVTRTLTALDGGAWRETKTVNTFEDVAGRVIQVDDLGDTATSADDRCTRTTYPPHTSAWLLDYPSRVETVAVACATTPDRPEQVIADDRTYYDGVALNAAVSKGDVTRTEKLVAAGTYLTNRTASYDPYGRTLTVTDALGNTTTTDYTETAGVTTATTVTGPPVEPGNPGSALVTSEVIDPAWGSPTVTVDAGGKATRQAYDALGRLTKVWQANRSTAQTPNLEFAYHVTGDAPVAVATKTLTATGGQDVSYLIYDGHQRARQGQTSGPDGGRLITDTFYDARGNVSLTYDAYYATGAPSAELFGVDRPGAVESQTAYSYDGLDRVVSERHLVGNGEVQEKWRITTTYSGDRVSVDPPAGGIPTTTINDARGQKVELRQYHGDSPSGAYDATTYTYTPAGKLATVTGFGDNVWTYTYDLRGRQIRQSDPDKGVTVNSYDDLDRLTSTTDARGRTIVYEYDPIGRKIAEYETSTSGPKLAEWTYDTARKGQLTSVTRYAGGRAYTTTYSMYDNLNRPLRTTITIPSVPGEETLAGDYTFGTAYNLDGTVQSTSYPAGGGLAAETVVTSYDDQRRATTLTGTLGSYVTQTRYSLIGQPLQYELSTGGRKTWLTYRYEYGTGRLAESRVEREGVAGVDRDATYAYNDAGVITSISDVSRSGTDNQCFAYDHLQRLVEAWTQNTPTCAAAPSTSVVAGPAPYWTSYAYHVSGGRSREVLHGVGGLADTVRTYLNPAAGQGHRLAGVNQSGGAGARTDAFDYDASGNLTTRTIGATTQTLTWDAQGHLATVTENGRTTSFVYDAAGARLLRRDPGGTTLYLPNTELRLAASSTSVTGTRYYTHNGSTVAARTSAGVRFLASDAQGTAQLSIDAATQALTQRRFTPFGAERGTAMGTWPDEKSFVGGTRDPSTGLIHLGAREYDPAIGRFISVDPLFNMDYPQGWDGYSYANNSPVSTSDPDGLDGPLRGNTNCYYANKCGKKAKKPSCHGWECGGHGVGVGKHAPRRCHGWECAGHGYGVAGSHARKKPSAADFRLAEKRARERELAAQRARERATAALRRAAEALLGYGTHPTCFLWFCQGPVAEGSPGKHEIAWCHKMGSWACLNAYLSKRDADKFANELFPHRRSGTVDYARWNAFHHAMWMAMMVSRGVSPKDALLLGAAHELDSFAPGRRRPFGPVSQIDLHNNAAGVQIGLTSRGVAADVVAKRIAAVARQPSMCGSGVCLEPDFYGK